MGWFGSKDTGSGSTGTTNVVISTDTFLEHLNDLQGTKKFRLLKGLTAVVEGSIGSLLQIFTEKKVANNIDGFVMDGITTQRLIDEVVKTNINVIVSEKKGPLSILPKDIVVLTRTSLHSPEVREMENNRNKGTEIIAREKEEHLDYEGALEIWVKLGNNKEAKRIRRKMMDEKKVEQTVVHGDYVDDRDTTYVDDRDTIIQDSVVSKSNIGAGGSSKMQELKDLTEMKKEGLIDDDDYEKMKREIIG